MKLSTFVLVAVASYGVLTACQTKKPEQAGRTPQPGGGFGSGDAGGLKVTYEDDVRAYMNRNCATSGCHVPGGESPDLSTYKGAKTFARVALIEMQEGRMPKRAPASARDIDMMKKWIDGGRLEARQASRPGGGSSSSKITYDGYVRNWLSDNCTSCHRAGATPPDLTTYELASAAKSRILARIDGSESSRQPMPPAGYPSRSVVDKVREWVEGGAPRADTGGTGGGTGGFGSGSGSSAEITYEGFLRGFLEQKCTSCHRAGGDRPELTSYDDAVDYGDRILARIRDNARPMPPSGAPPAGDVQKVDQWLRSGKRR